MLSGMTEVAPANFTLRGEFAGFFRDVHGKRRMVLRSAEGEVYLRISKALRREAAGVLAAGALVTVTGRETADSDGGARRRTVVSVRAVGAAAALTTPVFVCTKKNCWRSGGHAVWTALEKGIAESGLARSMSLQAAGCLGHCKKAPNVEWGGQTFHRCSPQEAKKILAAAAESISAR